MAHDDDDVALSDDATAGDTVRIRTSAADQPWKKPQPAGDGTAADGKRVTGGESAANYATSAAGSRPGEGPSGNSAAAFPKPSPSRDGSGPVVARDAAPLDSPARRVGFGVRPAARPELTKDGKAGARPPRKAHLVLRRVEPWSVMKFSFVVSLVCFVVLFVAVAVLYGVLSALGVFSELNNAVTQLTGDNQTASALDIDSWLNPVRILGYTALIGAVNVVLITALSTVGAVIYNMSAELVGGIEMTFSEAE